MKLFPILNSAIFRAIPWSVIDSHENQAQRNHSQSLARLAERGGLTPCEAVAVLEEKAYYDRWPATYTTQQGLEADIAMLAIILNKLQPTVATTTTHCSIEELREFLRLTDSGTPIEEAANLAATKTNKT